ncbi:hypothetical protein BZA05DRAFT_58050 [Tricharina praecox]|uniref:uncharacterized protein n=1 Tax=Tricharina praecox TaxID=43433 RepID=UPI0022208F8E|nr:uncharacterized protein BZA05DRAFT_58050 [Tricharina praecox]KAI5850584.1 hypothetical protein BZA05DRAFT_58050 [Tricharina praecox]
MSNRIGGRIGGSIGGCFSLFLSLSFTYLSRLVVSRVFRLFYLVPGESILYYTLVMWRC